MSQMVDANVKAFECDEALAIYRNVKMDADGKVTYADAANHYDGTTEHATFAAGDEVSVRLRTASGTRKMTAAGAIGAGEIVYAAADGKIDDSGTVVVGKALEAASGDASIIEVLPAAYPDFFIGATAQSLSGAGAANLTTYLTKWTTTGADAGTLADGTAFGQLKKIQLIVDGGDGTLTPATFKDGTTITFADAGDFALLRWSNDGWEVVEIGNDADGATAPVVA